MCPRTEGDQLGGTASTAKLKPCFLPSQAFVLLLLLLNLNTGIMEGGPGDRTAGEVNLDRLRPRGVKRRLTTENDTKGLNRVRRKRQKGQQPEEEEEDEVDEDGREEMERLVGLVPSLMGREGSVSQVK